HLSRPDGLFTFERLRFERLVSLALRCANPCIRRECHPSRHRYGYYCTPHFHVLCYHRPAAKIPGASPAYGGPMKRGFKIAAIVVGILIILLAVVPFLIPVNQFRPTIEHKASAALGRKVEVGNLSLSLLSGSLAADNLSIEDDPKFSTSPFLTAKSVKVGVELMPLIFSKALNITGVTIDTPQVTLLRNPAGDWNYSSFGASAGKSQGQQTSAPQQPAGQPKSEGGEFSVAK